MLERLFLWACILRLTFLHQLVQCIDSTASLSPPVPQDFPQKSLYQSLQHNEVFHWKDLLSYYYPTIQHKLDAMLHYQCKSSYVLIPPHSSSSSSSTSTSSSHISVPIDPKIIHVMTFPPSQELEDFWFHMPRPKQMRVDPFLCEAVYIKKKPIFNNTGCQLPHYMSPGAPRCQTSLLKSICNQSSISIYDRRPNGFVLSEADHKKWLKPPLPWMISTRDSFVTMCGQISTECGLIHSNANCMSTGHKPLSQLFYRRCPLSFAQQYLKRDKVHEGGNTSCLGAPFGDVINHYDRVFVVAEVDDTYIYHIHLEIIPRIVQHLQFLRENPDIKILIGCDTKDKKRGNKDGSLTAFGLKAGLKAVGLMMKLFDLPLTRFVVHQNVFAREVYLPMEGACQDPVYNTWQILSMRNQILTMLGIPTGYRDYSVNVNQTSNDYDTRSKKKPVMLLMKRSADSQHTRNRFDLVRQWSDSFTDSVLAALSSTFPSYDLKLYSDRDESIMDCFECQVRLVAEADVLIGVHGAGLGMSLYMPPNKAVIEFAPYGNDGRCLLGGGPFSRLATILSHNYMMHHPPYDEFKWINGKSSEFNVTRFVSHIESFLYSIGELS